jgi:methionine-rich copper-binding protein CopC
VVEVLEGRLAPAVLTVNSTGYWADPTDPYLTLREAIAIVNSPSLPSGLSDEILGQISGTLHEGGADRIEFDPAGVNGPITLGGIELELSLRGSSAVTIDGGNGVTLDGGYYSRLFQIYTGVQLNLDHMTLTHGRDPGYGNGGGILNAGSLTLNSCTLSFNNGNESYGNGGAIYNDHGTVTASNSTFSSNSGAYYGSGGAIYNDHGTMLLSRCTISSNYTTNGSGAGIYSSGTLTVTDCTVSANTAYQGSVGGIYSSGTLTVSNSTLSGNASPGPYGYGGAIYNNTGTLTVIDSTLSGNSSGASGGGIYTYSLSGPVTVSNSTLTGNSAASDGGGIYIQYGPVLMQDTIVAGNRSTASGPDLYGTVTAASNHNLIGNGAGLTGIANGLAGNLIGTAAAPIDPRLGPLADNGGPTRTHALLGDSPARGAGSLDSAPATDQRGLPRVVSDEIDIGSFQTQTAVAGPRVVASDPGGVADPPVDHVRLTFNHPIDPASTTLPAFSLAGPAGDVPVTGVTVVGTSDGQQLDVGFAAQTEPGQYALTASGLLRDSYGTALDGPQTVRFLVIGTGSVLTVNSTLDTADPTAPYLTLREAIAIVNSPTLPDNLSPQILAQIGGSLHANGSDLIVFDSAAVTGTIRLTGTQLELGLSGARARVMIDGGGRVTVDGNNASRVFQIDGPADVHLDHLTISHGQPSGPGNGGGILNAGTLTLTSCTLSANASGFSPGSGGAIYNDGGTVTVDHSTLSANTGGGGAISNNLGTLTVSDSILSSNAGGIGDLGGTVTVSNSTISSNSGRGIGTQSGRLTVTGSTISNSANGVYNNMGTVTLSNSTISGNSATYLGGGIYNFNGPMTVSGCTLVGNSAGSDGGGIDNEHGTLTLINSTLSANIGGSTASSDSYGGGIYNSSNGTLTVVDSTLTANSAIHSGGGLYNYSGTVELQNSIVAGNRSANVQDISAVVTSTSSHNLVGDGTGLIGIRNGVGGNLIGDAISPIDPRLGPLADNGGPTRTHALLADSPARGAGSLAFATATDQRGLPRTVAGEIDIGSFQTQEAVAGPQVVVSDPGPLADPPVDHVRLTFNHPIDPTSLSTGLFSLSGPTGAIPVTGVSLVGSSDGQQLDVSFPSQTEPGGYALTLEAGLRDSHGTAGSPSTSRFIVIGTGSVLTVNSTLDTANPSDPYLTLREAVAIANSPTLPDNLSPQILAQIQGTLHANGSDVIVFDPHQVTGPIVLTSGRPLELSYSGRTAQVTIDGGSAVTVNGSNSPRTFQIDTGAQVQLDRLTIHGGIQNFGALTLSNSTLSSSGGQSGSGIYNSGGTVTVSNSTLSGNTAFAVYGGGGAMYNDGGVVTVSNSTFSGNNARVYGGGIYNAGGLLRVISSTFSGNVAGNTSGDHGYGAGIYNAGGRLEVDESTLSGNSSSYGGGGIFNNAGTVTVSNSTLSANTAYDCGGLYNYNGMMRVQNTIVAGNRGTGATGPDVSGVMDSASSYNLVGDGSNMAGIDDGVNHNQVGTPGNRIDPRLAPLGAYGGPTKTMPPLANSPVLHTGDPGLTGIPDQRGVVRSGGVNIGSFQASAARFVVAAPESVTAGDRFDVRVSALDPFDQPAVGYTGTVSFSSADPQGASLPPDYPFSLADAGSHTFVGMTALFTAGTWDVTATDADNGISGSANVDVSAGLAVAFRVVAPDSAVSGTPFDVSVLAVDAFGNVDTHYAGTIRFSSSDGDPGVVLPADYQFVAEDGGTHRFPAGVTLVTAGEQTLTVTDLDTGITGSVVVTL